jgi:hypothetical protein
MNYIIIIITIYTQFISTSPFGGEKKRAVKSGNFYGI